MKINFVLPSIGHSGGIDVIYQYADLLTKAGHDVLIYKEIKASNLYRYLDPAKNLLHQIYCTAKAAVQAFKPRASYDRFVFILNDKTVRDADVVVATARPTAHRVVRLSAKKGRKYYFVQDFEVWEGKEASRESYELPLQKIVISSWINQRLQETLGIGPFPVVYNGLDKALYHAVDVEKEQSTIYFLMLNHRLQKKGVKNGLDAFEEITKTHPNSKLRMFGMCDRSNLPDYVEYYQNPSKEQLVELYSSSDIFLFPSLEEGWGLTPLEAMACGCVVVGTRTGFAWDLGIHEKNMMLSEPGDCCGMAANIRFLLEHPEKRKELQHGSKQLLAALCWEKSAQKFEKLLSEYD